MPSLKDLRNRISSVKSTKKITSAMKMVAAAKLRKAQENAISARPYSEEMDYIVKTLTENPNSEFRKPSLVSGSGKNDTVLLLICSADRGLCGGFNGSIIRYTRKTIRQLVKENKKIKLIFVGKKAYQALRSEVKDSIMETFFDIANPTVDFLTAKNVRDLIVSDFNVKGFDRCEIIYTKFNSAISQEVKHETLIPVLEPDKIYTSDEVIKNDYVYDFEPEEEEILNEIIPKNIAIQVFTGLLESSASEQGARMTAMDNATRNANDMIDDLTLFYNRSRQAVITKELIEIISGSEAI